MSAIIDYLSLTFRPTGDALTFARSFLAVVLGHELAASSVDTGHGARGYERMWEIPGCGSFAYGGNHGTVHVELTGSGCSLVRSFDDLADLVDFHVAKIKRIDLAYDDFEGARGVDWAKAQFEAGGFNPSRGVRPNAQFIDDMGSNKGRTLYVGSRESGKLSRTYEKGKQLGDKASPWVRHEVEFRAVHRVLTSDMIRNPSQYLSGSYPCLEWVSCIQSRITTLVAMGVASIAKTVDHARKQAGRALNMMLHLNGGDIGGAFEDLRRDGIPKRCAALFSIAKNITESVRPPEWWRSASPAERLAFHRAFA